MLPYSLFLPDSVWPLELTERPYEMSEELYADYCKAHDAARPYKRNHFIYGGPYLGSPQKSLSYDEKMHEVLGEEKYSVCLYFVNMIVNRSLMQKTSIGIDGAATGGNDVRIIPSALDANTARNYLEAHDRVVTCMNSNDKSGLSDFDKAMLYWKLMENSMGRGKCTAVKIALYKGIGNTKNKIGYLDFAEMQKLVEVKISRGLRNDVIIADLLIRQDTQYSENPTFKGYNKRMKKFIGDEGYQRCYDLKIFRNKD